VLEIHEDPAAVDGMLQPGEPKDWLDVPGSVNHFAFYVDSNEEVYAVLKNKATSLSLQDGPQPMLLGHTYLQRSLLDYLDPSGFVVQIAQIVDPRSEVSARRREKHGIRVATGGQGMLHGFDHVSIYITDTEAIRKVFVDHLGMREYGEGEVEGRKQAVFAVGMTDLEMNESDIHRGKRLGAGIVSRLGFWTDDVEGAYEVLTTSGVPVGEPPSDRIPLAGAVRRAFDVEGPDGLPLEIAELP
jgi:catechol 2,3-dioxygenase-like lactoylglutathione lyase family enzyme